MYVDKTKTFHARITDRARNNLFLISRPRRFGKSPMLSTLKAIYAGFTYGSREATVHEANCQRRLSVLRTPPITHGCARRATGQ